MITKKTDTGRTGRAGNVIWEFSKEVIAFENTEAGLVQHRARIVNRQGILSRLLALLADGDSVEDIVTNADVVTLSREAARLDEALAEVDEALALFI